MSHHLPVALRKRLFIPVVCAVAIILWVLLCHKHYDSYWIGTIRRVQTVDFNMLHHTLPTTLSYLIVNGKDDEIQKVLDANYGLFGIVITDPKGENIIYKTEAVYKGRHGWQDLLNIEYLRTLQSGEDIEHFDVLTDPPPLAAEWANDSPRQAADRQVGLAPQGQIIGRVYYVREPKPEFWSDVFGALTGNWLEMSGSRRGYQMQTLNIITGSLVIILVMILRRQALDVKEKELAALEKELSTRRRALEQLKLDLSLQRKRKEWLEQEAERAYQRALRLKQSLEKLKEAFFFVDAASNPEVRIAPRPPLHPPSALIEEIENLLPELTNNARILRSQAEVLQNYCTQLESRQAEMQQILERGRQTRIVPLQPQATSQLAIE